MYSFVGIAAVQIGLVGLLTSVGILPDYIIGYSVGELACAYTDGSLTLEETILAAYSLAISVNEIFAKVVSERKIPYHSRYITPAKSTLLANLRKVIPVAKHRSYKWLSTSVPRNEWSTSSTQYSFPEYLTNNLLKPVLFAQTLNLIPNNAVTIEITPDSQVHEILSKSLQKTVMNIALTQKDHKDNVKVFLEGLGKLYNVGSQLDLAKLYPPVEYPVCRGTPMISPLIRWEHSNSWFTVNYNNREKLVSRERIITVTYTTEEFQYIKGHVVDGRNLFPGAGYLFLVWETLGTMIEKNHTEISIVMENIKFNRVTAIPKKGTVEMVVMIQKGSGKFEVQEGNAIIITGTIRNIETNISKEKVPVDVIKRNLNNEEVELNEKDIYKEFKLRGYQYSGFFKSIRSASLSEPKGYIEWKSNWAAFMDNMMQMKMINVDTRDLLVPTGIQKLVIDAKAHKEFIQSLTTNEKYVPVQFYENIDVIVAGDISILDNIVYSFVRITAVQIGLVDLLTSVGILPDYIIGYSVGELGCAYADGILTLEETILAAYSLGISVIEAKIPQYSVAVVGLGYKNLMNLCPNDIDVVCHNGPDSSTIIGSAESLKAFVEKLQANEIWANALSEKRIPYHSRYIATAKSKLLTNLKQVIPVAKPRSYKWLSTSVPQSEWSTTSAQFSSAEYLTNNLLKPVLFAETLNLIPNNAVTIEITPDSQVHEIFSKSLQKTVMNIALTQKDHKDNVKVFLEGLGKLYNVGSQLDLAKLYPPVEYPVCRGTPMISPLIRWEHSNSWFTVNYNNREKLISREQIITVTYTTEEFKYIKGHVIDGRNLYPGAGYLCLVWETLGRLIETFYTEMVKTSKCVNLLRNPDPSMIRIVCSMRIENYLYGEVTIKCLIIETFLDISL
ncbi:hypothetical protein HZH66_003556 [Vespula vulgaris]|uniref:PKS/mFAS DH domain-containing protein n=1 Tax=Vespula vulgaris TaxID=7454 RepID=A0A834KDN6_VESVU|nr:hypothetical protein HZH66_003556 [Vespula vulgaris]